MGYRGHTNPPPRGFLPRAPGEPNAVVIARGWVGSKVDVVGVEALRELLAEYDRTRAEVAQLKRDMTELEQRLAALIDYEQYDDDLYVSEWPVYQPPFLIPDIDD